MSIQLGLAGTPTGELGSNGVPAVPSAAVNVRALDAPSKQRSCRSSNDRSGGAFAVRVYGSADESSAGCADDQPGRSVRPVAAKAPPRIPPDFPMIILRASGGGLGKRRKCQRSGRNGDNESLHDCLCDVRFDTPCVAAAAGRRAQGKRYGADLRRAESWSRSAEYWQIEI